MSKRMDILDGTKVINWHKKYGLLYTCNAGWLDLGHLNPENKRLEIGAANLWKQLMQEGTNAIDPSCNAPYVTSYAAFSSPMNYVPRRPEYCLQDREYKFRDGTKGFIVRYRQDHAGYTCKPGAGGKYIVKKNLTIAQKQRVALAIFQDISIRFEDFQASASWFTDSGYSQEDLVSNLIGFYIAIGKIKRTDAIAACKPVSDKAAFAIWDRYGPVGKNKNKSWTPKLAENTGYETENESCDDCLFASRKFPKEFSSIAPAVRGVWHVPSDYSMFSCVSSQ